MHDIATILAQYYGMDWAAMVFGLSGFYLITRQNRLGFLLQGMASILGCSVALMSGQGGFIVSNIAFMLIASYGFMAWAKHEKTPVRVIVKQDLS